MFDTIKPKMLETRDAEFIPPTERYQRAGSLFWLWFASNLTIGDFAIGLLAVSFGLGIFYSFLALAIGTVLGAILLALMSLMGPKFGYPQMKIGMSTFGRTGGTALSALQWGNTLGWFTFNSIIAASALALVLGTNESILPIAITVIFVLVLAVYGERIIHLFEKGMAAVLGVLFVVLMIFSINHVGITGGSLGTGTFSAVSFGWIVAFAFSYIMSWGPYASDYSRYLPKETKSRNIFLMVFAGGMIASLFSEIVGYYIGIASPTASENPAVPLHDFLGGYAAIGMAFLFLGGLSANALNLYSNSMSIKSVGVKISRPYIALIVAILAGVLSYVGYRSFYTDYEDFLLILDYWITPWIGIMVIDYLFRTRKSGAVNKNSHWVGAILSYLVAIAVSIPFMYPASFYIGSLKIDFVGPIASILGVDISYFISFLTACVLYLMVLRLGRVSGQETGAKETV